MKEIKFRARRKLNGDWVYGSYVYQGNDFCRIIPFNVEWHHDDLEEYTVRVITETVSQYTGLKDKHGKEIYEGDVIQNKFGERFIVEFKPGSIHMRRIGNRDKGKSKHGCYNIGGEIIGNIYEHPELLNQQQ